jgi:hypothetical protein
MGEERMGGEEEAAAAARAAEQARELQDAAAALLTRTRAEEEALRRRAAALQEELRRLRKAASAHADSEKVRSLLADSRVLRVCAAPAPTRCGWAELPDQRLPPDCRARLGFHALLLRWAVTELARRGRIAVEICPRETWIWRVMSTGPDFQKCQFASLQRATFFL